MAALKYSRQREAIIAFLRTRYDHPTADVVYSNIRQNFPNISLGTVYRNLSLLAELGKIQKLTTGSGPDRFDANTMPHYHFICKSCQSVIDLPISGNQQILALAQQNFDGEIDEHTAYFYGTCSKCMHQKNADKDMELTS